ncbi:hypothetical protein [Halostella salina]|uniref:hypothetical protein n=1 Tax=Halostella salina TaxID=1547897 RepID=UPI000EF7C2FF|nr:hypothetical protein [Halostella salina]
MSDETTRVWLVERTFVRDELGLVSLVYATPDGERYYQRQISASGHTGAGADVTREVSTADLQHVDDEETAERYASEVDRMQEHHDPEDTV